MAANRILPIPDLISGLCMCNFNPLTIQAMLNHFATGNRSEYHALVQRQEDLARQVLHPIQSLGYDSVAVVSSRDFLNSRIPVRKMEG